KGGHRPRALRRGHDPQSDDRAAAPAAWHGAVRAGSHLQAVDRAHDDSHPAVANPTVGLAVGYHPRPRAYPVAAARHRAHPVAAGAGAGALLHPRRYGLWAKALARGLELLRPASGPGARPDPSDARIG